MHLIYLPWFLASPCLAIKAVKVRVANIRRRSMFIIKLSVDLSIAPYSCTEFPRTCDLWLKLYDFPSYFFVFLQMVLCGFAIIGVNLSQVS